MVNLLLGKHGKISIRTKQHSFNENWIDLT